MSTAKPKGSGFFDGPFMQNQRGQASLMARLGNRTRFRWRGGTVDSRFRRQAIDSTQAAFPDGLPRCADNRTAANSASLSGVLTRSTRPSIRRIGQGDGSGGLVSVLCGHRRNEPRR